MNKSKYLLKPVRTKNLSGKAQCILRGANTGGGKGGGGVVVRKAW